MTDGTERLFIALDRATGVPLRVRDRNNVSLEGRLAATSASAVDAALVKMFGEGDWLRRGPRYLIRELSVSGPIIDVTLLDQEQWRIAGTSGS